MASKNGWNSYQKLVLSKLDDHTNEFVAIKKEVKCIREQDVPELRIDIATLKLKAGIWGAMAGVIPGIMAVIYVWLKYVPTATAAALVGPVTTVVQRAVGK